MSPLQSITPWNAGYRKKWPARAASRKWNGFSSNLIASHAYDGHSNTQQYEVLYYYTIHSTGLRIASAGSVVEEVQEVGVVVRSLGQKTDCISPLPSDCSLSRQNFCCFSLSLTAGFEPFRKETREYPSGFQVHRLNHSAKLAG